MKWLIAPTFVLLHLLPNLQAGDTPREQIGEVLGNPVYRDQLRSSKNSSLRRELHVLFTQPVWKQYLDANKAKLEPSEHEITALLGYLNKRREQERPKLEARLAEVKKELSQRELAPDAKRKLEAEHSALEVRIKPLERGFALWWISHWKQQRLLYDQYGGGRVIWQQAGLEALDAMHAWLKEQEKKGKFRIADPELRELFYEYWTTMKHSVLRETQVKRDFLEPVWLRPSSATPPKK